MRLRFVLMELAAVVVGLSTFRCGTREPGGSGSSAVSADSGYAGADAGPAVENSVGADGGALLEGGAPIDAGTSTTGGKGNDAGISSGGSSLDAGNGGPPATEDCTGLQVPSDPGVAPVSHSIILRDSTGVDRCGAAAVSGTGTVALTMQAPHYETMDFVSPSGTLFASQSGGEGSSLIAGEDRFIGHLTESMTSWLQSWNDTGFQSPSSTFEQVGDVAENPLGGVVALTRGATPTITGFDPSLAVRWRVNRPVDYPVALAVDRLGATLFLFDGTDTFGANTLAGLWIDRAGVAGKVFQVLGPQQDRAFRLPFNLAQRVGSGLFLALGPAWITQIDSLATTSSEAPVWLQARPNTRLHMTHGGKGYAILPVEADAQACEQDVEVLSPSGASCGTTRFRAAAGTCRTGRIIVGYDGTVVQPAPDPDPAHQEWFGQGTCYWHWWPGFFR